MPPNPAGRVPIRALPPPFAAKVTGIGADGDGLAELADGTPTYVAFTLPGEDVSARCTHKRGPGFAATLDRVDAASPERVDPPCPHFGRCGGCALQHWQDSASAIWKAERVAAALSRAGFTWLAQPAVQTPQASRRRIDLAARRFPSGVVLGLHAAHTAEVLAIPECRVLHPALLRLVEPLRATLDRLAGVRREASALLNLLDTGPDLLLRHDAKLTVQDRQRLAAFASSFGLPRIATKLGREAWEIACAFGPATIRFADIPVSPPPGAFLQASRDGEAEIVNAVVAGLPERRPGRARVAELFAGCGTLTFPLARAVRVTAFEGDAETAICLAAAARTTTGVTVAARDLARQPLSAAELSGFAAVVLDPPFGGALEQMPAIAASGVPRIIYVSCNPVALARDAALLAGAHYQLVRATAIDQFRWSPHVESVTVFARDRA